MGPGIPENDKHPCKVCQVVIYREVANHATRIVLRATMAQESHSPVLVFDSPVMVLHSPVMVLHSLVLVFTQSSFNFYTVQFYFFTQSSFIFTRSIHSPVLFSV